MFFLYKIQAHKILSIFCFYHTDKSIHKHIFIRSHTCSLYFYTCCILYLYIFSFCYIVKRSVDVYAGWIAFQRIYFRNQWISPENEWMWLWKAKQIKSINLARTTFTSLHKLHTTCDTESEWVSEWMNEWKSEWVGMCAVEKRIASEHIFNLFCHLEHAQGS